MCDRGGEMEAITALQGGSYLYSTILCGGNYSFGQYYTNDADCGDHVEACNPSQRRWLANETITKLTSNAMHNLFNQQHRILVGCCSVVEIRIIHVDVGGWLIKIKKLDDGFPKRESSAQHI